ncbi:hypothetical protein ACLBR5_15830 [Escherichia coli]
MKTGEAQRYALTYRRGVHSLPLIFRNLISARDIFYSEGLACYCKQAS